MAVFVQGQGLWWQFKPTAKTNTRLCAKFVHPSDSNFIRYIIVLQFLMKQFFKYDLQFQSFHNAHIDN